MLHYQRLHWFPFCPADWISKCMVNGLSIPAQGCLISLLCVQWLEGSIPSDPKLIAKALSGYTGPGLHEALALFVPLPGDHTRLWYLPLEAARQEAIVTHERRSQAGRKGAFSTNKKRGTFMGLDSPQTLN